MHLPKSSVRYDRIVGLTCSDEWYGAMSHIIRLSPLYVFYTCIIISVVLSNIFSESARIYKPNQFHLITIQMIRLLNTCIDLSNIKFNLGVLIQTMIRIIYLLCMYLGPDSILLN